MVKIGVNVTCDHCDYTWVYSGKDTYPGKVLCPECRTRTPLPEKAVNKESKVI